MKSVFMGMKFVAIVLPLLVGSTSLAKVKVTQQIFKDANEQRLAESYAAKIGSRQCTTQYKFVGNQDGARKRFQRKFETRRVQLKFGAGTVAGTVSASYLIQDFIGSQEVWRLENTSSDIVVRGARRHMIVDQYSRNITLLAGDNSFPLALSVEAGMPLYFFADATGAPNLVFMDSTTNTDSILLECK